MARGPSKRGGAIPPQAEYRFFWRLHQVAHCLFAVAVSYGVHRLIDALQTEVIIPG